MTLAPVDSSSGQLVEKEIDSGNPPVTGNEEIRPGVSRRLTGAARYPSYLSPLKTSSAGSLLRASSTKSWRSRTRGEAIAANWAETCK